MYETLSHVNHIVAKNTRSTLHLNDTELEKVNTETLKLQRTITNQFT